MILITGAAGKTGRAVLKLLSEQGVGACAFVRNKQQAAQAKEAGAKDTVIGNLELEPDLTAAMRSVDQVYFIPPNVHPREDEIGKTAIVAALKAGVARFVYHSVLFPQMEAMPHHWRKLRVEEALLQSSLDFSILQPANYMQNLLAYKASIHSRGVWELPYSPEARSTPVDLADVAEIAAMTLTENGHGGASYPLAGPEVLSSTEMARLIGGHLGMDVRVQLQDIRDWEEGALRAGLDKERIATLKQMFSYYDQRDFVGNSGVLELLLGRSAGRLEDFLSREWD